MGKRIISGAAVALLAIAAIFAGSFILSAALLCISCIAYRELCRATKTASSDKPGGLEIVGYIGIVLYYGLITAASEGIAFVERERFGLFLAMLFLVILMLQMAVYVITFPKYRSEQVMAAFFCMIYAPVLLSFIYLTTCMRYGFYLVWMIFISSWVCDTCAYFTGVAFGRHKLAPVLSPKKSIEGAVGGVVGSAVVGALFSFLLVERAVPNQTVTWVFALIGGIGAAISQIGDLAASAIKRNHEIKDYGTCIPGHGGIMDRFDSVIFTAPIIYFLAQMLMIG